MRRITFHIGDRKTGTSSLQYSLTDWDNTPDRDTVYPAADLLYARSGRPEAKHVNHANLAHQLFAPQRFHESSGGWAELGQELKQNTPNNILVSSEGFESVDPVDMKAAIDQNLPNDLEVRILCYIRPHMKRIVASYTQNVKTGKLTTPIAKFARTSARGRLGQLHTRLGAWRDVFGDSFKVKLYDRSALHQQSIIDDILVKEMGLPQDFATSLPVPRDENSSPGAASLEILRQITMAAPDIAKPRKNRDLNILQKALREQYPNDTPVSIPPKFAQQIYDICLPDAQKVDAEFFGGKPVLTDSLNDSLAAALAAPAPFEIPEGDLLLHATYRTIIANMHRRNNV